MVDQMYNQLNLMQDVQHQQQLILLHEMDPSRKKNEINQ
jgi:hypothetical protein